MSGKYKTVRANDMYIGTTGELPIVEESQLDKLKEVTKDWTFGARLTAINEELHLAADVAIKVELLELKSKLMEQALVGKTTCVTCSHEDYHS